ncbi:hypothetical protein HK102_002970, partial [Quaeritorhiza haematococci]
GDPKYNQVRGYDDTTRALGAIRKGVCEMFLGRVPMVNYFTYKPPKDAVFQCASLIERKDEPIVDYKKDVSNIKCHMGSETSAFSLGSQSVNSIPTADCIHNSLQADNTKYNLDFAHSEDLLHQEETKEHAAPHTTAQTRQILGGVDLPSRPSTNASSSGAFGHIHERDDVLIFFGEHPVTLGSPLFRLGNDEDRASSTAAATGSNQETFFLKETSVNHCSDRCEVLTKDHDGIGAPMDVSDFAQQQRHTNANDDETDQMTLEREADDKSIAEDEEGSDESKTDDNDTEEEEDCCEEEEILFMERRISAATREHTLLTSLRQVQRELSSSLLSHITTADALLQSEKKNTGLERELRNAQMSMEALSILLSEKAETMQQSMAKKDEEIVRLENEAAEQ